MADVAQMGTLFNPELVADLFNKVRGESTIAALCGQTPIAFTGNEVMTFSMDDEIALVGESEQKTAASMAIEPVKIVPVKVEYGARVTDEFMYATDEKKIDILGSFNDGFAKKVARGIDIMAFHKLNPRTGQTSSLIQSAFTDVDQTVDYNADAPDDALNNAINKIDDYDITGIALSRVMASALGQMKASTDSNLRLYPEFAFGAKSSSFYGTPCGVNSTVSFDGNTAAIVGDFANAFKWGFAKEIPLEVIPYGDPDGSGKDLKAYNQVYLRSEAYIGWAILDPLAFCKIVGGITTTSATANSVKTTSAKKE